MPDTHHDDSELPHPHHIVPSHGPRPELDANGRKKGLKRDEELAKPPMTVPSQTRQEYPGTPPKPVSE